MAGSRQTISFLTRRFQEAGIRPAVKHGQNFLIDLNLLELLVQSAELTKQDVVLEVGTGIGSLTGMIAERAAAVVTVEIDPQLHQLAREELIAHQNVVMLRQDVLKNKNTLHADVLHKVAEQLREHPGARFKVAANLPYNVGTPVLSNLLMVDPVPVSMTVTIQKELADRIAASPGTKDYSALSIWMQSLCEVRIIRTMSPAVFWPRPKVSSAIIQIVPRDDKRRQIPDLEFFHNFVRSLFLHRRKVLRVVLPMALQHRIDKNQADAILSQLKLPPECRAEQLDIDTIRALSETVRRLDA